MSLSTSLGIIPSIVIAAVVIIVVVWLFRFIYGIKKTKDFYKSRISVQMKEDSGSGKTENTESEKQNGGSDPHKLI